MSKPQPNPKTRMSKNLYVYCVYVLFFISPYFCIYAVYSSTVYCVPVDEYRYVQFIQYQYPYPRIQQIHSQIPHELNLVWRGKERTYSCEIEIIKKFMDHNTIQQFEIQG